MSNNIEQLTKNDINHRIKTSIDNLRYLFRKNNLLSSKQTLNNESGNASLDSLEKSIEMFNNKITAYKLYYDLYKQKYLKNNNKLLFLEEENDKNQYYRELSKIYKECDDLQQRKAKDYQNVSSSVLAADYYPHGMNSISDMLNIKLLRIKSLLKVKEIILRNNNKNISSSADNDTSIYESIEDSLKDLINYSIFGIAWLRRIMPGQNTDKDIFNE